LIGGLPLLFLSLTLFKVWLDPMSIDQGGWLRMAATLVVIEFLLLHSGGFMAAGGVICNSLWQRLAWFVLFALVYGGSIWAFAAWSDAAYVAWILSGVLISRLLTLVILRDKKGTIMMFQRSAVGTMILVLTALVCFIPLPELGVTEALREATFGAPEDLMSSDPQRFIAWGVLYFLLMALTEFYVGWRLPDWSDEEAEKGWKVLQQ